MPLQAAGLRRMADIAQGRPMTSARGLRYRTRPAQAATAGDAVHVRLPDRDDWIVLRGTAKRIWGALDYPTAVADLARTLAGEYDAPADVLERDIAACVASLTAQELVAICEGEPEPMRDRYLSLLKHALGNLLYPELELQIDYFEQGGNTLSGPELQRFQRDIAEHRPADLARLLAGKQQGMGPLRFAHTMIGQFRLGNIERCAEQVFADLIPGDFLEAGVCKGGAAIFMRALQIAHGEQDRKTWVVDSFQGVPPSIDPDDVAYGLELEEDKLPWLACSEAQVREHFSRYRLLDDHVEFVSGWIADSLPRAPIGPLAILRVDVDLYSSTRLCLELLYDKVVPGGFVIVDDYGFLQCCRDAVDAFRAAHGVEEPIRWIDRSGIYWRKSQSGTGDADPA